METKSIYNGKIGVSLSFHSVNIVIGEVNTMVRFNRGDVSESDYRAGTQTAFQAQKIKKSALNLKSVQCSI